MFLNDVDYLIEKLSLVYTIRFNMFICISCHLDHHTTASDARFTCLLMHLHHTGSQEELPVAIQEEQTGSNPQEAQAQEVSEVDEQEEDLPECVEHQPSSFERGKPRSILSLLLYKSNSLYIYIYEFINCALSIEVE
jgi:hypothetical protein